MNWVAKQKKAEGWPTLGEETSDSRAMERALARKGEGRNDRLPGYQQCEEMADVHSSEKRYETTLRLLGVETEENSDRLCRSNSGGVEATGDVERVEA